MRKARWVEELFKSGAQGGSGAPAGEHVTIVGISPAAGAEQGGSRQLPGIFAPMAEGGTRLTGAGVDGAVQPGKRTGEVHEGEGVLSANAMQALAPDEFHAFSQALEAGKLNKNIFRQSFGLPPVAGFSEGGIFYEDYQKREAARAAGEAAANASNAASDFGQTQQQASSAAASGASMHAGQSDYAAMMQGQAMGKAAQSAASNASLTGQAQQQTSSALAAGASMSAGQSAGPWWSVKRGRNEYGQMMQGQAMGRAGQKAAASASQLGQLQEQANSAAGMLASNVAGRTALPPIAGGGNAVPQIPPGPVSYKDGMQFGYDTIYKTAQGDSPVSRTIANKTLNDLQARQQWQTMGANQTLLNNPNLSPEARAALASEMRAGHSAQTANVAGNMAIDSQRRAGDAARDLVTLGQSARMFEEVTLPEAQVRAGDEISRRITALSSSTSLSGMKSDSVLRDLIARKLGPQATAEAIDREIEVQWAASNDRNKGAYASNVETLLGDLVDNKRTVDDALGDSSVRRNVAGMLGLDANDPAAQARIDDEIRRRYEMVGRSRVDVLFDNLERIIPDEVKGVEGWESDLKNTIRDLLLKGVMDKEGNIKDGVVFDWPWEDPRTYFRYNDWNGKTITGGNYDKAATVNVAGNGTSYVTSAGKAVSQEDADSVWNNLSAAQREKYFSGGAPDVKTFMDDWFRGTRDQNGNIVPVLTPDDFLNKVVSNSSYADYIDSLKQEWTSGRFNQKIDDNGTILAQSEFVYYDLNGNLQRESKQGPMLGYIWEQLTQKYRPDIYARGELLTAKQFADVWNDGKDWYVDSDGRITNMDSKGSNPVGIQTAKTAYESWSPAGKSGLNTADGLLLKSDAAAISAQWDSLPADKKAAGSYWLEEKSFISYGAGQWNVTQEARVWAGDNAGRLYRAKNGRVYEVVGYHDPQKSGTTGYILLRDAVTGQEVQFSNGGGKSARRPLTGERYAA